MRGWELNISLDARQMCKLELNCKCLKMILMENGCELSLSAMTSSCLLQMCDESVLPQSDV